MVEILILELRASLRRIRTDVLSKSELDNLLHCVLFTWFQEYFPRDRVLLEVLEERVLGERKRCVSWVVVKNLFSRESCRFKLLHLLANQEVYLKRRRRRRKDEVNNDR